MTTLDTAEKELPVLLCLHSLFLDPRMFDDLAAAAAGRYRVIRPEFRGQVHGTSNVSTPVTMDACADDVISLIDQLDLAPVFLVASSMGGDVAIRIETRRPDTIAAMALLGSSACAEPPEAIERHLPLADEIEANGFQGELLETMMKIMFGETSLNDPAKAPVIDLWRERIAAQPKELCHAVRGVVLRDDATHRLPAVKAPTLIISGDEDLPRPPAWSNEMARRIPGAEIWRLPKVGHSPILEAGEEIVPRILSFFESSRIFSFFEAS